MHRIIVIGGSTIDLKARAMGAVGASGVAPGRVEICPGGAARNIAENLARLSIRSQLLTAIGTDDHATEVVTRTALAGVDVSRVIQTDRLRTASVLSYLNQEGHRENGLADLGVLEMVTADYLERNEEIFPKANAVVVDTTPPLETLRRLPELCARHKVPLVLVPSYLNSLGKVQGLLKDTLLFAPSRDEAALLTGEDTTTDEGLKRAAEAFLESGVKLVLITLEEKGVYYRSREDEVRLPAYKREVVDRMGADNAFLSGFLYGFVRGLPLLKALEIGQFTASLTLDTIYNVHPKLKLDYIHSSVV